MRFISKQQIEATKLYAVFYKPKLTFHFSKTLAPPKVYENPQGGRGKKRKKKSGFKHSGGNIHNTYFTILNDMVTKN